MKIFTNIWNISRNATELLQYACEQGNGEIRKIDTITGSFIGSASRNFITPETSRETSKWKAVLKELSNAAFIELVGGKGGEIYNVTAAGYDFIDNYKAP